MGPLNRFGRRHHRSSSHIRSCPDCSSALRRERQYLERLRGAAIPAASDDLTARLLTQTQQLAMSPAEPVHTRHHPVKVLVLATGGVTAAAGIVALAGFMMAGDPLPVAGSAPTAALLQQTSQVPSGNRNLDVTQLTGLRTEGWACPELQAMGFHVISAKATVVFGRPALEMRLSDGTHYATVLEQHATTGATDARAAAAGNISSPVNALTGHPAAEDGFVATPAATGVLPGGTRADGSALWIKAAAPWSAIYQTARITFTYVSDLPSDQADDAVAVLGQAGAIADVGLIAGTQSGSGKVPAVESGNESIPERVQRGLRKIVELLAP